MNTYYNPVTIVFSESFLHELAENIFPRHSEFLFCMGKNSLKKSIFWTELSDGLRQRKVEVVDGISSNPDIRELFEIQNRISEKKWDAVIAVGGGSVMDVAKILSALYGRKFSSVEELRSFIQERKYQQEGSFSPVYAFPTTAGTGSEVTMWATLWDREAEMKYSVSDPRLYPKRAVLDPMLTAGLSVPNIAIGALDALSHATESYWSKEANELTRCFSLRAVRGIVRFLEILLKDPAQLEARREIQRASLYAGLAFSNTKTTICHSVSYPLTWKYDIPHGIAVSMTLGAFAKKNEKSIFEKEKLLEAFGTSTVEGVEAFVQRIHATAGLSPRLRDYGVLESDLGELASHSLTPGRADNNPVRISEAEVFEILRSVY